MRTLILALFLLLSAAWAPAFPPSPYYRIYGMVRDQVGQSITDQTASVLLLKGGLEVGRTPINSDVQLDQNYALNVKIDQNRSGTALYHNDAIPAQGVYSLAVEMNGALFYPIEVQGTLTAGKGGELVRLDLNLGEDTDGDGLPDIWEAWQLYQAGYSPDANGKWPINLINKNGDFDNDGVSNWLEYVAGTFAGDATEKFELKIQERLPDLVRCDYYEITGKTYTIESSVDMKTWTRVSYSLDVPGTAASTHVATDVGVRSAFIAQPAGAQRSFYRLTVR